YVTDLPSFSLPPQIDKICKVANKPLVVTYTGLIQACLDAGNVQHGACIFNHMHKFCCPNLVTCNIMLKAYLDHGMFEEAKDLFQKMVDDANHVSNKEDYKDRVIPDIYTFNAMLDACVTGQQWDDFEFVYKQMLRFGHHFNAKRHLRMIMYACKEGKVFFYSCHPTSCLFACKEGKVFPFSPFFSLLRCGTR
ncbi:hypothetical protein U1Q18_023105, partial [Sarracenia purpurea var. burkii]